MNNIPPGLYAITDSLLLPGTRVVAAVEAAIRGGAVMVQFRDKHATTSERLRLATDLAVVCAQAGVPLIINDDPQLAKRVGASGVHLGQTDGNLTDARHLLGDTAIIGATCHTRLALAEHAVLASADYIAFGRFFRSATKPDAPAADPAILTTAQTLNRPIVAIGGITLENGEQLIQAGADHLAVVGGLFGAENIEARARDFTALFQRAHPFYQREQPSSH